MVLAVTSEGDAMSDSMSQGRQADQAPGFGRRLTALAAVGGFFVAAAEMVFMSSPFAAYFYAFYSPLLRIVGDSPHLSWLSEFWVSHVYAPNPVLGSVRWVGSALVAAGIGMFLVHAAYLYWAKFRTGKIADRLLYARVRHPQYAGLMVAGLGLALLWPRFIDLGMFLAMSAAYVTLAGWEEAQMNLKFGAAYRDFAAGKSMFFPGDPGGRLSRRWLGWVPPGTARTLAGMAGVAALAIGTAALVRDWSVHSLQVVEVPGQPGALLVPYVRSLPENVAGALAPIARGGSESRGMRVLFVMNKKKMLEHLLVDSGVEHTVARRLEVPDDGFYVVRTVVRPPSGADARGTARDASRALSVSAYRKLDGVFSILIRNGRAHVTEIVLPARAFYRHARVPLL